MVAIVSLLIVLALSLLITRIASMALVLTGVSHEAAVFQARSAFTGVGFTTMESEEITSHPVRRRIVMALMLAGNLGIGAVIATVMASFNETTQADRRWLNILALALGLSALWTVATSRRVEKHLNRIISWVLRTLAKLEIRDYVAILQLQDGYAVSELTVEKKDWLAGKSLLNLRLPSEGVLVLGIQREEGVYLGTPTANIVVEPGDTLILYGPIDRVEELDQRRRGRKGDEAHEEAIEEHEVEIQEQKEVLEMIEKQRELVDA